MDDLQLVESSIFFLLCGVCCVGAALIIAGGYFLNSVIASLYWWTSFLLSGTLFIGMWSLAEKSFHFRHTVDEEVEYDVEAARQLLKARHEDPSAKRMLSYKPSRQLKTIFFQEKAQENILHQSSSVRSFGPKLFNIKELDVSKKHSTTRRSLLRHKTRSNSRRLKINSKSVLKKKKSKAKSKPKNSRLVRWKSSKKRVASISKKQRGSKQLQVGSKRKKLKLKNQNVSKGSKKLKRFAMI